MCNVKRGSRLAELISSASLIIIDEVTMLSRYIIEALDRTLRDLMRNANSLFGGIPVVLSGKSMNINSLKSCYLNISHFVCIHKIR